MSHDTPEQSVMLPAPNVGPFVRCLLQVHIADGYTVASGVWIEVHPDDLQRGFVIWWEPECRDLVLEGGSVTPCRDGAFSPRCDGSRPGRRPDALSLDHSDE
jgi:hypothetical protein